MFGCLHASSGLVELVQKLLRAWPEGNTRIEIRSRARPLGCRRTRLQRQRLHLHVQRTLLPSPLAPLPRSRLQPPSPRHHHDRRVHDRHTHLNLSLDCAAPTSLFLSIQRAPPTHSLARHVFPTVTIETPNQFWFSSTGACATVFFSNFGPKPPSPSPSSPR